MVSRLKQPLSQWVSWIRKRKWWLDGEVV